MNYEKLERDFAQRTRRNLDFIEERRGDSEAGVYEVTQLVNSILGILVLARERLHRSRLQRMSLDGWPVPERLGGERLETVWDLVKFMRNAVAHLNVTFLEDEGHQISGVTLWDYNEDDVEEHRARFHLEELDAVCRKLLDLLEGRRVSPA